MATEKTHIKDTEKKKIEAKPLPVDKEKTKEIEKSIAESKNQHVEKEEQKDHPDKTKTKDKKKDEKPKVKKYEAVAYGKSLPVSLKKSMYLCRFIKNKKIDAAIHDLEKVMKMKTPVPFKGEIPHRKGKIMSGRYPVKTAGYFINVLKGLKGNALVNGLELEETRISTASPSWARRPMKAGGRLGKRVNLIIKATEPTKEAKK